MMQSDGHESWADARDASGASDASDASDAAAPASRTAKRRAGPPVRNVGMAGREEEEAEKRGKSKFSKISFMDKE